MTILLAFPSPPNAMGSAMRHVVLPSLIRFHQAYTRFWAPVMLGDLDPVGVLAQLREDPLRLHSFARLHKCLHQLLLVWKHLHRAHLGWLLSLLRGRSRIIDCGLKRLQSLDMSRQALDYVPK